MMNRIFTLLAVFVLFAAENVTAEDYTGRGSYTGLFSDPRLSKVTTQSEPENRVVLSRWDHAQASTGSDYFTGTLFNDSYGGVYDLSITFLWKNAAGVEIGTDRAVLMYGQPANIRGSYSDIDQDYIAPLQKGYFQSLVDMPPGTVISKSSYVIHWTWTLQAYVNTDVGLQGDLTLAPIAYGQREITGTVKNSLAETLETVEVFTIFVLDDGTVDDIAFTYVASSISGYMLGNSQRDFEAYYWPLFSDGKQPVTAITGVTFDYLDDNDFYTNEHGNAAYYTPPATGDGNTAALQDKLRRAQLGDLNLDGQINITDFLLFVENFGKSSD